MQYEELPTKDEDFSSVASSVPSTGLQRKRRNVFVILGAIWLVSVLIPSALYLSTTSIGSSILSGRKSAFPPDPYQFFQPSDIAVLLKTGASVIQTRLGIHFEHELANLTFPLQIYSDYAQTFQGHKVIDILKDVPQRVRFQPSFRPYAIQKEQLDQGIPIEKLEGAWSLDKYKFIPILADAYKRFPEAKWYINIEADTYLFMNNFLRWLAPMDPTSQSLFGSPVHIDDARTWFAHGGSGFVLSQGLMKATFGDHANHVEHVMDDFQANACCGDEILARALYSTPNVYIKAPDPLSHQLFTGETPTSHRYRSRNWCQPIMSFHHMKPEEIAEVAVFEQELFPKLLLNDFIRNLDVFKRFAPPFLSQAYEKGSPHATSDAWDNRSEEGESIPSVEGKAYDAAFCHEACILRPECFQWSFKNRDGEQLCKLEKELLRIGAPSENITSGWMTGRAKRMFGKEPCEDRRFR